MSRNSKRHLPLVSIAAAIVLTGPGPGTSTTYADDWPQWRGPNRDAKATGFTAPKTWPKELTKKWQVTVGNGVASPALVGDKLFVLSREGNKEVVRALDATTGKEVWKDEYETEPAAGPASRFPGPRSSPTVADGKVITLGVRGILSCYDATSGKLLWRKDDFKGYWPTFFFSSSPIVVDGLCIAQLGGKENGQMRGKDDSWIVAYDLASGTQKWKWNSDSSAYASPALATVDGTKVIVAETEQNLVGISTDGKQLWKTPFAVGMGGGAPPKGGAPKGKGMGGRGYNASTPMVEGQTLIYSGSNRGTKAVKLEKKGEEIAAKEEWTNAENSVMYNTPVVHDGLVFGLTAQNSLFCITKDGKTAWTAPIKGREGYGSIVDAGAVLFVLTPAQQLTVFEPSDKEFKELASYKVADSDTYAYPVISGNRIYVKDADSVTLWTIE